MNSEDLMRKIYTKGLYDQWGKFLIERWIKSIVINHVGKTNQLAHSFKFFKRDFKNGVPSLLSFAYDKGGTFTDMGVGKGVKFGMQKELRSIHSKAMGLKNARHPKKWKSKTLTGQIKKLTELMASQYGRGAAEFIKENISIPIVTEY